MSEYIKILAKGGGPRGMGHVMRSLNVARALKEMDMPVYFLFDNESSATDLVEENGFTWCRYRPGRPALAEGPSGVVVMDTEEDVTEQIRSFKEKGSKVLLIDNSTRASMMADLSITPSAFMDRRKKGEAYAGSKFVIIGDNFFRARKAMKPIGHDLPLKILVTMGWCDANNITLKVLKALSGMEDIKFTVVLGPDYGHYETLEPFLHNPAITFRRSVKDMAPLMASSHIAFTALGTTVYELAFMGVPPLIISNYREDEKDLAALRELKVGVSLGFHGALSEELIRGATARFVEDASYWREVSAQAKRLSDGRGAWRIATIIAELDKRRGRS